MSIGTQPGERHLKSLRKHSLSSTTMDIPKSTPSTSLLNTDTATASFSTQDNSKQRQEGNDTAAPPPDDIFLAAQRGDVALLTTLLTADPSLSSARDAQNITPLHWAAINAHLPACRLLLAHSAPVDALGGDLVATPMQWAARNGYLYIIHLLLSAGADPSITDSQGYNTLHLATHSSGVMSILYLLQQRCVEVDAPDAQGHTALMWAAYQGDALSVDILLDQGRASALLADAGGLTPLHWAVVRANRTIIQRLVKAGADVGARDAEGRTARDMAVELKSLGAYTRALREGGYDEYGVPIKRRLSERWTKVLVFMLPSVALYLIFSTFAVLPWYTAILLSLAEFFGMHHIVTRVLLPANSPPTNSPYFAGIIAGSMIWVFYAWVTRLLSSNEEHSFAHLFFALAFGVCAYNFFRSITLDPGTTDAPQNSKEAVEQLVAEGRLNGQTWCVPCGKRRPLRSRHCRVCRRCVARFDHHCPWVWNCVGVGNHRQFLVFVATLVLGIGLFDYLVWSYFGALQLAPELTPSPSCPLPPDLCILSAHDPFLLTIALWSSLQLSWTVVLLASQLWQVARQLTTLEVSNLGRWGFMGGRGGVSLANQHSHQHTSSPGIDGSDSISGIEIARPKSRTKTLLALIGLDRFSTTRHGLMKHAKNPFDTGSVVGNCNEFWTTGGVLGVEYGGVWDVPEGGFLEQRRRNSEADRERDKGKGKKRVGRWWKMGMGGGRRRGGYSPLGAEEVEV